MTILVRMFPFIIVILFTICGAENNTSADFPIIGNVTTKSGYAVEDRYITMNMQQMLREIGFDYKLHNVTTKDGYILQMIQIINPYLSNEVKLKPIFLQHGLGSNSDSYVAARYPTNLVPNNVLINEKNEATSCDPVNGTVFVSSLGLTLANCGYDVWVGNFRGNYHSYRHTRYTQSQSRYWDYTLDSLSEYDLVGMLDYVLDRTQSESIAYIGMSLGTTTMFQLLASKPEYRSKIETFIAIAPIAQMSRNIGPVARSLAPLGVWASFMNQNALILPARQLVPLRYDLAENFCRLYLFLPVCLLNLEIIAGVGNTDPILVPQAMADFPDAAALKLFSHYAQRIESNYIVYKFDYGRAKNLLVYGRDPPPAYNISSIDKTKIVMISGTNDVLASPTNVEYLYQSLQTFKIKYEIEGYNHLDFILGRDADTKVVKWTLEKLSTLYPK